jgi:hypothetical protein
MSSEERIRGVLETERLRDAGVTIGGSQFPSLEKGIDSRLDNVEAAVVALRFAVLELAKEIDGAR